LNHWENSSYSPACREAQISEISALRDLIGVSMCVSEEALHYAASL
jgi:hypothetical protein